MCKTTGLMVTLTAAAALGFATLGQMASPQDSTAEATYRDVEQTLGSVPTFFKMLPQVGVGGAWGEFKNVQLNPNTRLSGKVKELIGLVVAAQIP